MKSIARWSSKHIIAARFIIGISHLILATLACYSGIVLQQNNINIPIHYLWLSITSCFLIFLLSNKLGYNTISFYKKKLLDCSLIVLSFIMILVLSARKNTSTSFLYSSVQGSFTTSVSVPASKPTVKELKKQWKQLRAMLKGEKPSIGAVIGAILIALLLTAIVAAASCSLACNGQDALAVLVLLGGLTATIFITRLLLKRKKQPKIITPQEQTTS